MTQGFTQDLTQVTAFGSETIRDHGGGIDAAVAQFGGTRSGWLDLSTGINPVPYPLPNISADSWTDLPDSNAQSLLEMAAQNFWDVPKGAAILAAPGASSLIARIPTLAQNGAAYIPAPTYNEHAAAFRTQGWSVKDANPAPLDARVLVHPNNPTGRVWNKADVKGPLCIIDESFCDTMPEQSLIAEASNSGRLILKSFGKFWGLAGVRLGFAIGDPTLISRLVDSIGPWAVSGPALEIGARALADFDWAQSTRIRLAKDAARLDDLVTLKGARVVGGTSLFRLYDVDDAKLWQDRLAQHHIWTRRFPYSSTMLRLGLPAPDRWAQLESAL